MNKWQAVVLIIGLISLAVVLVQTFVIHSTCLYSLCPVHDPTVSLRSGLILGFTGLAMLVLRTPHQNGHKSTQPK